MNKTLKDFVTIPEAARQLGLPQTAVRQFRQEGRLGDCLLIGRQWLIPRAAFLRFSQIIRPTGRPKSKPDKGLKNIEKSGQRGR